MPTRPHLAGLTLALLLAAVPLPAQSDDRPPSAFDPEAAIAYSQAAIGRTLGDHAFLDDRRRPVRLADYRGKPLVVNLVYTACTESCPVIVQTLYRAVAMAQDTLGADSFAVLTIGFDSADDTPERMRSYARGQGVDLPSWRFLSGDAATVERLAAELGFIYFPSPRGFDHLAQTTVVDADGRVHRQVYGADFKPPALIEPVIDLVYGRRSELTSLAGLVNRVRLFCTFYNPASDRYEFDYSIFIALAIGLISLSTVGGLLIGAWLRSARAARGREPVRRLGGPAAGES